MKTIILVLARPDEALAVKYDDSTRVDDDQEGYDLKRDQVTFRLDQQGLPGVGVEFFNARDESSTEIRQRLIERITQHRKYYADQIQQLATAVRRLDDNRKNEQTRLVFEHVLSDLNAWIRGNRDFAISETGVEQPLISAIDGTRYASTIRAAVRRHGDWYNLDYYHHLAYGVRKLAVDQIGARMETFKTIVHNLMSNPDLEPAREFLQGVLQRVDALTDESYQRTQSSGREAFKQTLAKDLVFWSRCETRWGQGPGYRIAIRDMTDEEFERNCDDAHKFVIHLLSSEWHTLIERLENMLRQHADI